MDVKAQVVSNYGWAMGACVTGKSTTLMTGLELGSGVGLFSALEQAVVKHSKASMEIRIFFIESLLR